MDSNTWALLTLATTAVAVIAAITWRRRPLLRSSRLLAVVLGVSAIALTVEVILLVVFVIVFAAGPAF